MIKSYYISFMDLSYKIKNEDRRSYPLSYWTMEDDTLVAIYQGYRGEKPDLDFIVKYKTPGKRLRTPSHTHWIVDLLVKCEYDKELVQSYMEYLLNMYDVITPFQTQQERQTYTLTYVSRAVDMFGELDNSGYYSIKMLTTLIELFSKCEKQTTGAFMFKGLLCLVKDYCGGKRDFYQIVGHSKRV